jgi:hypothetical protein
LAIGYSHTTWNGNWGARQADRFDGDLDLDGGDGISWEDPLNWLADVVPLNNGSNILIGADHQVVFDADTFAALDLAGNLQNATEHRIARLLMGDSTSGAFNGSHSLTLDQGDGNFIRATNSNSAVIGGRAGKFSTLNIVSGDTNLEANRVRVGQAVGGSGTVNVSGGLLICGRGGLELSNPNGNGGDGTLNITGGSFRTRGVANIYEGGIFHVAGSAPLDVGIGTHASVDGAWNQEVGGILRTGIDATGFTTILIDDVDDDGAGTQGNATFAAGSILDPYDMGGAATGVWTTVMTWEGTLSGAPTLSEDSVDAGWESQIDGSNLQVRLTG